MVNFYQVKNMLKRLALVYREENNKTENDISNVLSGFESFKKKIGNRTVKNLEIFSTLLDQHESRENGHSTNS